MKRENTLIWDGWTCGGCVVLVVLATCPFAEMGFFDDFSYFKTTLVFAQTGHVVYNGWATPMLGWQIAWGALFLKCFGVSFTAARMSTLTTAFMTIILFHAVLRRFGLERRSAVLGALTLGLSPLFVPMAASFMTDINGLFVLIACLYLCQRAVAARTDGAMLAWLVIAALTNIAGGTVRQIAWLGSLVVVPSTAWLVRKRRHILPTAGLLWLGSVAAIAGCLHWFVHQLYSIPESVIFPTLGQTLETFAHESPRIVLCLCLVSLPALFGWLGRARELRPSARVTIVVALGSFLAAGLVLHHRGMHGDSFLMPWIRDLIGDEGASATTFFWMIGPHPVTLNIYVKAFVSLVVLGSTLCFLFLCAGPAVREGTSTVARPQLTWRETMWLTVPYGIGYVLLLVPRTLFMGGGVDRYLLGLLPVVIPFLLRLYQERFGAEMPAASFAAVAAMAVFSVTGTHDMFALNRARLQAVGALQRAGVPLRHIQAGSDFDGWTQLAYAPNINDPRIRLPAGTYHPVARPALPAACVLFMGELTPEVTPAYVLTLAEMPCLGRSGFPPVPYRGWLPPFERWVYTQETPGYR